MDSTEKTLVMYRGAWHLYWREGARPVRRSLGTADRLTAERRWKDLKEIGAKRQLAEERNALPVRELWNRYKASLGDRPCAERMRYEEVAILPAFGDMLPADITIKDVERYTEARYAEGRKPGTVLTELNSLTSALSDAVKNKLLDVDKVPHIPKPASPPPRDYHITKQEAASFRDALVPLHGKLFFVLALATGARKEAILGLPWERVDLDRRLIYLADPAATRRMKGRAIVPINDTALALLTPAKATARTGHVIEYGGRPISSVRTCFVEAESRSGVQGVTPHVLRHSAAVWMAEDGQAMSVIAQYLGHADSRITERVYARYSPTYLRGAASSLDF